MGPNEEATTMLQLSAAIATLANVNLRIERIGKDKTRPAADLKFTVNVPNTQLDELSPGLLRSLYRHPDEKGHQGDLVSDPNALTTLRHARAKPWASTEDWPGYFATISAGTFDQKSVELDKVVLKSIVADAKNGGTVELSFSLGCHPSGEDVGKLYEVMGQDIELILQPPAIGDLERLRAEQKAANKSGPDDEDDDDGDDAGDTPPSDAASGRAFPDAIDARGDAPPSARKARGAKASAVH